MNALESNRRPNALARGILGALGLLAVSALGVAALLGIAALYFWNVVLGGSWPFG